VRLASVVRWVGARLVADGTDDPERRRDDSASTRSLLVRRGWRHLRRVGHRRLGAAPAVVLVAQVLHVVGDAGIAAALATTLFFDVPVGEARTDIALYLLVAFAPYAVLAPLVSLVSLRRTRTHGAAIVASDVGRAVLAALLVGALESWALYPLGLGLLVLSRIHSVNRNALLADLMHGHEALLAANAAVSLVSWAAGAVGGAVMFGVASALGASTALVASTSVFAAGALIGLWLSPPDLAHIERQERPSWTGEGSVQRLVTALVAARVALGFTGLALAFEFHGGDDRLALVVALGALGAGGGVAPLVVAPARRALPISLPEAALVGLVGVGALVWLLDDLWSAIALGAAVGVLASLARLGFDAHVQERLPVDQRERAYSRYETVLQLGWVAGAAVASLVVVPLHAGGFVVAGVAVAGLVATRLLP